LQDGDTLLSLQDGDTLLSLQDGDTLLLQAALVGDLPNVKLLVERGAKLDATDRVASHHLARPFLMLVELT
jgi:ankyrin repeat protein